MRRRVVLRSIGALTFVSLAAGCGGGTPTSPGTTSPPAVQIPLGPQTLRILVSCPFTSPVAVFPLLYTRVTVSKAGDEWVANAGTDSGDVEVRFHQAGASGTGTILIGGTIKGTAMQVPALAPTPVSGNGRATFGSGGSAAINGVAFNAGVLSATAGIDGTGTGTVAFSDGDGGSCSTTSFTWAIFQ